MNLTSRRARVLLALGSVGAVVAAGATAINAIAAGNTLAFGPTATSATIVDVDPNGSTANAGLSYGLKVTGESGTDPTRLDVLTAPTNGSVMWQQTATNSAPAITAAGHSGTKAATSAAGLTTLVTAGGANLTGTIFKITDGTSTEYVAGSQSCDVGHNCTLTITSPSTGLVNSYLNPTTVTDYTTAFSPVFAGASAQVWSGAIPAGDAVYVGATVPGTYTFRLFQDHNGNGVYDAAQDDATPTFSMTVKDATGASTGTTDDLAFNMSAPTSVDLGKSFTATAAPGLTSIDTRGIDAAHGSVGALGYAIAQDINFTYAGAAGAANTGHPTFDGTSSYTRASGVVTGAGTITTTPTLVFTGAASPFTGTASSTTAASNLVTGVALAQTSGQTANVLTNDTSGVYKVRTGTGTVNYTATVTVSSGAASGKTVWFTLGAGSGTALTDLTANGAAVPSTGLVSATTDANGVATLAVVSAKTANTNAYTVQAESNNVTSDNTVGGGTDPITATYTTPAATTITTSGNQASLFSGTVTITGTLKDQWSQVFKPASGVQATLDIDKSNNGSWGDYTHTVDIPASGTFTSDYSDSSLAAARTDAYRWTVSAANYSNGDHIEWVTTTTPAHVTLATINGHAFPDTTSETVSAHGTRTELALVGTVTDASSAAMKFADFTLTGSAGVFFKDANGALQSTLQARTNASGQLQVAADQSGNSVTVVLTKTGAATITATSGSVSSTGGTLTVADSADPYTVTVNSAAGLPGSILVVTGTVTDMFGNAVPSKKVDLSVGSSTLGSLGATTVTTNSLGTFSTTFTSGSNQSGTATLTATLWNVAQNALQTTNAVADTTTAWTSTIGLTGLVDGKYQATSTITVAEAAPDTVTLTGPSSRVGAGSVTLTGVAKKSAVVDIYAKTAAGMVLRDSVTADATTGAFSSTLSISSTTTFVAKTATATSAAKTVTVIVPALRSTVSLTATALGSGKVKLASNGGQRYGTTSFQVLNGKKWVVLGTYAANANGDVTKTFKTTKGVKTFRVVYTAPGRTAATASATVRVK
jgi:hypothetical protein